MPNKYKLQFNKRYLKDIQKVPKKDRKHILKNVLSLANSPRPIGYKKLKGSNDSLYRIRCGDYRGVYTINDAVLLILVIEVGHRKDIYR